MCTTIRKSRVDVFELNKLEFLQVQFFISHWTAVLCKPQIHPNIASAQPGERHHAEVS